MSGADVCGRTSTARSEDPHVRPAGFSQLPEPA